MRKSYTYDPEKLGEKGVDRMRFELGDVMVEGEQETCALSDEEYRVIIKTAKNWKRAKLAVLESIMRRFAYEVDTTVGPLKLELQARAEHWRKMYDAFKKECADGTLPCAGTPSPESKEDAGHYFYGGMHDNENAVKGGERNLLFKAR